MRQRLPLLLLATLLFGASSPALAEVAVVATLPDLAALAAEVGGPDVTVKSLALSSDDPHFVDARPSLIVTLSRADLVIENGLELEIGWFPTLLRNARNAKVQRGAPGHLDASTAVAHRLEVPGGEVDRSHGDIHGGGNPHYTQDPRAAVQIAAAIRDRLVALDPAHADGYRERYSAFARIVTEFDKQTRTRFATLPPAQRKLIPYHRSWSYLLDWLGLTAPTEIEPKPGVSPSPSHTAAVITLIRRDKVRLIIQERYYPAKTAATVARIAGATFLQVPGQTRFEDGERYLDHIRSVTGSIYDVLAR